MSKTFNELLDDAMSIPGYITRAECRALLETAFAAEGDIIEVGAWQGRSTSLLAAACKDRPRRLFVIDSYVVSPGAHHSLGSPQLLFENLARLDLCPDAFLHMSSNVAARCLSVSAGMVFIDADHRREPLQHDIQAWCRNLGTGARVVFHDYGHERWTDVKPCIDEWLNYMGGHVSIQALVERLLVVAIVSAGAL